MIKGWKVLVLNSDWTPLQVASWEEILHLPLEGLAVVHEWAVDADGQTIPLHAGGGRVVIDLPSVIQVKRYVKKSQTGQFNRHAVYARDDMTCQYCGDRLTSGELTIDHVVPRHILGGEASTWGNCVACCRDCNGRKGGRTLEEMRKLSARGGKNSHLFRTHNGREFYLLHQPTRPSFGGFGGFLKSVNSRNMEWLKYIPKWRELCRANPEKEWLIEAFEAKFGDAGFY